MAPSFHADIHNVMVDRLVNKNMVPSSWCVKFVFERPSKDDVLRELFVELECSYGTGVLDASKVPAEFVKMVEGKMEEWEFEGIRELKACGWHIHHSKEEKLECERMARDRA
jgi:hypothetical protein